LVLLHSSLSPVEIQSAIETADVLVDILTCSRKHELILLVPLSIGQ
jgi:hypothetical protein